jgi:large subunit ribosomal protein L13
MKTYYVKPADVQREWVLVDASGKTLGRLATELARILRGKHKAFFAPHMDCGDSVIVINSEKIVLTGNKATGKSYFKHTGYIGGIKEIKAGALLERKPERLVETAVKGMMPKNKVGRQQMKRLRIYAGGQHPHTAQKMIEMAPRLAGAGSVVSSKAGVE